MFSRFDRYCIGELPRTFRCVIALSAFAVMAAMTAGAADAPSAVGPLMKLFQSGRLPAERQGPVVEMICNRGNEHDLRVIFDRIVQADAFAPDLRLKAIAGLTDAATNRKVKPVGDLNAITELIAKGASSSDRALQLAAIRLASVWKVASISDELQLLATDEQLPIDIRSAAIDGLAAIGDPANQKSVSELTSKTFPLPIRMRAVSALAAFDVGAAAEASAAVLADCKPSDPIGPMMDAILSRKGGADLLATAIERRPPSMDLAKLALRYMYSVGRSDALLSDVLSKTAGVAADQPAPTGDELARIVTEVATQGNAERGEQIFRRAEVSCFKCHSINRAGGQVGPELSAVGGSSPVDYIVNSILNPSLAVKEQYVTKVFETSSGELHTGIVVNRDDVKVSIRDATGKIVTLPTADIEDEMEGQSLMPQGLTKFLTRQEFLDLAKFISELGKPGAYEPRKIPAIQRWKLLKNPPPELIDQRPHLEHIRQFVMGSHPEDWESVYGMVSGLLPLEELRQTAAVPVLILQGEIQVNQPGKVSFELSSDETTQVWVDAQPFELERHFTIDLEAGRHTVTVRVEPSGSEMSGLKVEVTKPDDSKAQFEVIGGA